MDLTFQLGWTAGLASALNGRELPDGVEAFLRPSRDEEELVQSAPDEERRAAAYPEILIRDAAEATDWGLIKLVGPCDKDAADRSSRFGGACLDAAGRGLLVVVVEPLPRGGALAFEPMGRWAGSPEPPYVACLGPSSDRCEFVPLSVGTVLPAVELPMPRGPAVTLPLAETYGRAVRAMPRSLKRAVGDA